MNHGIEVSEEKFYDNGFIFGYKKRFTNTSGRDIYYVPTVEIYLKGKADFYMIPCVNYNGNAWGEGNEPKGLTKDGNPWVFAGDRTGIPGATFTEEGGVFRALFAGNNKNSLACSCSIEYKDGGTVQRLYFGRFELPERYSGKFIYSKGVCEKPLIKAGQTQEFTYYTAEYPVETENYGYKRLIDWLLENYAEETAEMLPEEEIYDRCLFFAQSLVSRSGNDTLVDIGLWPDENDEKGFRIVTTHESGWAGHNVTLGALFIKNGLKKDDENMERTGKEILNTWLKAKYSNGLMSCHFEEHEKNGEVLDSCNLGWSAWQYLSAYRALKTADQTLANKYLCTAKGITDFFINCYDERFGIYQTIKPDGTPVIKEGMAGGSVIVAWLEMYRETKEKKYFTASEKVFSFYYEKYLKKGIAGGAALDTFCVDKESAGFLLRSALMLYHITENENYLKRAENAAYYLMTWMYYYDVIPEKNSDMDVMGFKTAGGTAVSVQHHHIDKWGAFYVADLYELAGLTKKATWSKAGKMVWEFCTQLISDGNLTVHARKRPRGAQNEAVFQCDWSGGVKNGSRNRYFNDWLIVWMNVFEMLTIDRKEERA